VETDPRTVTAPNLTLPAPASRACTPPETASAARFLPITHRSSIAPRGPPPLKAFPRIRFDNRDFVDPLPDEGFHPAVVCDVRCRVSENHNPVVQVTYQLGDTPPDRDRLVDHFIVSGGNLRAIAVGRRRLLSLCRACGIEPQEGEELSLQALLGAALEVRVVHDTYQDSRRARVRAYRSAS
jgi:hypothetical protein